MVKNEPAVYLLARSSEAAGRIQQLKEKFLPPAVAAFNLDTLYASDLTLATLQERLLSLPVGTDRRLVIIKNAGQLKSDVKRFILSYAEKPSGHVILVLEAENINSRDEFMEKVARLTGTSLPREVRLDTFMLSRQIEERRGANALKVLHQLLDAGEAPERIVGGLRYAFENRTDSASGSRQRLKLLLDCDLDIKTGRLKPDVALERLLVRLCYLKKL